MMIDLMNNLHLLAEDKESVVRHVAKKARTMDKSKLMRTVQGYAGARTQSFFEKLFQGEDPWTKSFFWEKIPAPESTG